MLKTICGLFIGICMSSLSGMAQALPANWNCNTNEEFNVKICHPATWNFDDTTSGAKFFVFSPAENAQDQFSQNFNLQASNLGGESINLQQYVKLNIVHIKANIKNYQQVSIKNITVKGVRWSELVYTGNLENDPLKIKFIQRFAIDKGNAFVLTYSAEANKPDKFYPTALKIFNSIEL